MPDDKLNKIKEIFTEPHVQAAVVEVLVPNRKPKGWGRKSHAPYYKEIFAKGIKADIDKMIETGHPLVYRYATLCDPATNGMSKDTLYQRVNHSIRFLVECMDIPDGDGKYVYRKWYDSVRIKREPGLGVTIRFIKGLESNNADGFKADVIEPESDGPVWRRQMEEWLDSDNEIPFHKDGLALTTEQIAELKTELAQVSHIMASVTSTSVKLIKKP